VLAFAFPSFLLGSSLVTAQGWDAQRFYTAYQDALVFISVETVDHSRTEQGKKVNTGTGFLLNKEGYVLSNSHVVPSPGAEYRSVVAKGVTRSQFSAANPQPLAVIQRFPEQDLVLLKFPETGRIFTPVVIGNPSTTTTQPGEVLFTMGFPLKDDLAVTSGRLLNKNAERGRWLTDLNVTYGNSGGPVFNKDGVVVAVVVGGILGSTVNRYVIPIQYAQTLLVTAGLPQGPPIKRPEDEHPQRKSEPEQKIYPNSAGTWFYNGHERRIVQSGQNWEILRVTQ
jgi:S1-C subfamily serine protease